MELTEAQNTANRASAPPLLWVSPGEKKSVANQGWRVEHKRVVRMMAEDNLLAVRRRKYIVTTESEHDLPVFRNVAATLKYDGRSTSCGWPTSPISVCSEQFLYLAVVLDAFPGGWWDLGAG